MLFDQHWGRRFGRGTSWQPVTHMLFIWVHSACRFCLSRGNIDVKHVTITCLPGLPLQGILITGVSGMPHSRVTGSSPPSYLLTSCSWNFWMSSPSWPALIATELFNKGDGTQKKPVLGQCLNKAAGHKNRVLTQFSLNRVRMRIVMVYKDWLSLMITLGERSPADGLCYRVQFHLTGMEYGVDAAYMYYIPKVTHGYPFRI